MDADLEMIALRVKAGGRTQLHNPAHAEFPQRAELVPVKLRIAGTPRPARLGEDAFSSRMTAIR